MFDIFYSGTKPNLFAHEQPARDIEHARELSGTRYFWWVNYLTDYTGFDFLWEPVPWQAHQRHAWPSQWQKDSDTYLVPKQGYIETHYRTDKQLTRSKTRVIPIIEIDHMDGNCGQVSGAVKTVRYFDNYRDVLTRIANTVEHEYVWIVSSVCDYSGFDFSWHPEFWQKTMLHVFASGGEKFGDTFYMHVPSFRQRIGQFELLDWYDVNFVGPGVPRRSMPMVRHNLDTHVEAIKTMDWPGPLAVFSTDGQVTETPTVPLWRERTKTIVPLSAGASQVIVPKTAVPYIKTQAYDYPYIDRTQRHLMRENPLDIVFIDNGEPNADENWKILLQTQADKANHVHRSSGVNGRVAAYHAAARLSTTPWFFAVFAKLRVDSRFNWAWQPDRMQEPKHYIFHAYNPINELEYGHQALIAYNKKLVLDNPGQGLDFTLDSAHEVVPILSGTAEYAYTAWMAWRTAFRECVKLCGQTDVESKYRLRKWLEVIPLATPNAEWSQRGAEDAVEYYESVGGAITELQKSYDWAWLASYALLKRNLVAD
jgi:hypothetical protein